MNIYRLTENELKEYAHKIASRVVFTDSKGEPWVDESTEQEHEIIFNVAYGALNGLKCQGAVYDTFTSEAILCYAEYILGCFLPELNAYLTIWKPLMDFVSEYNDEIINHD